MPNFLQKRLLLGGDFLTFYFPFVDTKRKSICPICILVFLFLQNGGTNIPLFFVELWKMTICLLAGFFHFREIKAVGSSYCLFVDAGAADDKNSIFFLATVQGFVYGVIDIAALERKVLVTDDNVSSVGQGSMGERLESLSSHQYCMPCCCLSKLGHVCLEVKQQTVVVAYGIVLVKASYQVESHIATC